MGEFIINGKRWQNNIMNDGVKKLMRILGDIDEEDHRLVKISVGISSDDGENKTLTELVSEIGGKYDITTDDVSVSYPFDLQLGITIPDTEIDRPETIKEVGVWFGDDVLFARAVDEDGTTLGVGEAVTITYSLVVTA